MRVTHIRSFLPILPPRKPPKLNVHFGYLPPTATPGLTLHSVARVWWAKLGNILVNQIGQNFDNLLAVLYSIYLPISIKVKVLQTNSKTKFSKPKLFCLLIFFYFYFSPWYVYMPILPCGALNVPILKQAPCSGCHKIHSPSFPPSTLGLLSCRDSTFAFISCLFSTFVIAFCSYLQSCLTFL